MKIIKINEKDNTAVALEDLKCGEKIGSLTLTVILSAVRRRILNAAVIFTHIILGPTLQESFVIHISPIIPKYPKPLIKHLWDMYGKTAMSV